MSRNIAGNNLFRKHGFTLVEVLLVTAIFASIGLAVFTCLSNGLKLWSRSQRLIVEEDATIFFDRFSSDLRNAFVYSHIPFEGGTSRLAFPTVVYTPADRASARVREGYVDQIGMVRYSFDSSGGNVVREQANYSQATHGNWGSVKIEVSGVKELRFRYFYPGSSEPALTAAEDKGLPSGVEVEIRFPGGDGDKILKRYVPIPAGV
jgi:prepilin-type N-terminal cleavage/methylation domain-containing protein